MNAPDKSQDTLFYLVKTVARHSAVYGLFDFLGRATSLVLVPLYVYVMTPADFGVLEIFTVTNALLLALLVLGFNSALIRYYTTASEADARAYFRTAFTTVAAFATAAWLVLCLAAPSLSHAFFGDATKTIHWRLLFTAVFFDAIGTMFLALFRSQSRPFRYSWVNLGRFVSILGLNVVLVGVLRQGVVGALTGNVIGAAAGAVAGAVIAFREIGFSISPRRLKQLAVFGLPLVVSGIALSFVMASADRYFLKSFATLTDLGVYSLGYKVGMIMSVLLNAFVVAWPPVMFKIARQDDAPRIFSRVLTYYLVITGFVLAGVASFSDEIVGLIATPDYAAAAGIVFFVLLSYLLQGVYYIMSAGVTITDRTRWVPVVVGVSALVNLAANILLIPRYGIQGAAWATLLSYSFLPVFMRVVSQRYYPVPIEWRRILLLSGAIAAVLFVNRSLIGHATLGATLLKTGPLAGLPLLLLAGRFFSADELLRGRIMLSRVGRRSPFG